MKEERRIGEQDDETNALSVSNYNRKSYHGENKNKQGLAGHKTSTEIKCFHCNKIGHYARDCRKRIFYTKTNKIMNERKIAR